METSEFIRKLTGRYLWLNLLAMAFVVALMIIGANVAMNVYTHHGESITIPDVRKHSYEASLKALTALGMDVVINDTGYVKNLPPGTILDQLPQPGTMVKSGRTIYLTVNATDSPTLVLPDIIDNSSLREAMARLSALGFKLNPPQYVSGEKDWVYGIVVNGKHVSAGDRISIESRLTVQVGNGQRSAEDSVYMTDMPEEYSTDDYNTSGSEELIIEEVGGSGDDFEIIE